MARWNRTLSVAWIEAIYSSARAGGDDGTSDCAVSATYNRTIGPSERKLIVAA